MADFSRLSVRQLIKFDMQRYVGAGETGFLGLLSTLCHDPGALFTVLFRLSQGIDNLKNRFLRVLLRLSFNSTVYRVAALLFGVHISARARIGKGFCILHPGCIYIGPVKIGTYCSICQEVTIGYSRLGDDRFGLPTIGDQVYIAPGAKIFGKIRVGNRVSIGANAVVSKDLPDGAIAVGNPARIVGYQDTNPYIENREESAHLN